MTFSIFFFRPNLIWSIFIKIFTKKCHMGNRFKKYFYWTELMSCMMMEKILTFNIFYHILYHTKFFFTLCNPYIYRTYKHNNINRQLDLCFLPVRTYFYVEIFYLFPVYIYIIFVNFSPVISFVYVSLTILVFLKS